MIICLICELAISLVLAWTAWTGTLGVWGLYLAVMGFGAARTFEAPCQQTFLPSIASPEQLPRATALSASLFQAASIAGPGLGGLLYGLGAGLCYAIVAAGMAASLVCALTLRLRRVVRGRAPATLETLFGGIAYVRRRPELLGAISLDLFAVLLGGAVAMLPVYARDILHAGPEGLGLLRAAPAVGALAMSLWLARQPMLRHAGVAMFASVVIFGLGTIAFGLSRNVAFSVAMLALLGAADVVSVMVRSALVQLGTPEEMLGRVAAVNMLFIGSSNQLGEFESGMLAWAIGPVPAVVLGGVGTVLVAALWWRAFPGLRRLDRLSDIRPE